MRAPPRATRAAPLPPRARACAFTPRPSPHTLTGALRPSADCINAIRFLAIDGVEKAKSGHPGLPMGAAPMSYLLWNEQMKFNPKVCAAGGGGAARGARWCR